MRGDKDELEEVYCEGHANSLFALHVERRFLGTVIKRSLKNIQKFIENFIYTTYQGFGIIMWLLIVAISPLVGLYLFSTLPFPLNAMLAFGVTFGFVCVSRSQWK